MKLELGSGHRPTRGYDHNDLYPFDHIEHVGAPWMLDLPDESVEEVLALGFIEHLTYDQARDTFRNVHRMLAPGGLFLFDVPDYPTWARWYLEPDLSPWPRDHVLRTLFGWQRWPGDEHKSGWDPDLVITELRDVGYRDCELRALPMFRERVWRRRFTNQDDAHLYVCAYR